MISKQNLSSKVAIFVLLVLFIFLGNIKYRQYKAQREILIQKENLQAQADSLQKKNDELNQSLQYISSPSFKERVARQDLGLKKQGETVYNFIDSANPTGATESPQPKTSNFQKWRDYFFSTND